MQLAKFILRGERFRFRTGHQAHLPFSSAIFSPPDARVIGGESSGQ